MLEQGNYILNTFIFYVQVLITQEEIKRIRQTTTTTTKIMKKAKKVKVFI